MIDSPTFCAEVPSHALLRPFSIRAASSLTKTILDHVGCVCEMRSSRSKHSAFKQVFEDTIPVIPRYRTNVALWRCLAVWRIMPIHSVMDPSRFSVSAKVCCKHNLTNLH